MLAGIIPLIEMERVMGEIGEPARRIEVIPVTEPVRQPMPEPSTPSPVVPSTPEPVPA